MRKLGWVAAIIAGFVTAPAGFAGPANARELAQLTNGQLDKITAASAFATGTGAGTALGMLANTKVMITTGVIDTGFVTAAGQVTSSASSSSAGPDATASSTLSLRVITP